MEEEHKASPSVVPRRTIPVSSGVGELEVRPFLGHDLLGSVISESDVALSWIEARAGQDIAPRSEAMPGLLIVLDGSAELVGTQNKTVRQGDVITLPEGQPYGFRQVGADGLHALHVMFRATSGALRRYIDSGISAASEAPADLWISLLRWSRPPPRIRR